MMLRSIADVRKVDSFKKLISSKALFGEKFKGIEKFDQSGFTRLQPRAELPMIQISADKEISYKLLLVTHVTLKAVEGFLYSIQSSFCSPP